MNKKGFVQVLLNPKIIGAIFRFIIGVLLFKWAQPELVSVGVPPSLATPLLVGVLVGLGIWSYVKLPF